MAGTARNNYRLRAAYAAVIVIVAIWATSTFAVSPPDYIANRRHVVDQISAFEGIATFFRSEPDIETLTIQPGNEIAISVDQQGQSISVSDENMESLVDMLMRAKVEKVSRRTNRLEYYAGSEMKFGRSFQARVIRMADLESSLRKGTIRRCSMLFGFFKPAGECLTVLYPNLGIHYLWVTD